METTNHYPEIAKPDTPELSEMERLDIEIPEAFFKTWQVAPLDIIKAEFENGRFPDLSSLVGREFDGYNAGWLAHSTIGAILGIKKFRKRFYHDEQTHTIKGYNYQIIQDSWDLPWSLKLKDGNPIVHGFFDMHEESDMLLLDYTKDKRNGLFDGGMLKDIIVETDKGLLIGRADFTIGSWKPAHSYFVLKEVK